MHLRLQLSSPEKPRQLVGGIVYRIFGPIYADHSVDHEEVNRIYVKKLSLLVRIQMAVFGLIAWQAGPVVRLLFGAGWAIDEQVVVAMCLLGFVKSMLNPLGSYLHGIGRPDAALPYMWFDDCLRAFAGNRLAERLLCRSGMVVLRRRGCTTAGDGLSTAKYDHRDALW